MELDTFLGASDQTGEPIHSTLGSFSRANKLVCVCIGQQNQGATQEEKNIFWRTNLCWVSNFYWNGWAPSWNIICHSLNKSTVFEPKVHLLAVAELSASKNAWVLTWPITSHQISRKCVHQIERYPANQQAEPAQNQLHEGSLNVLTGSD